MQQVELGSLSIRTYQTLRKALIEGNFRPGERLHMQNLSDRLGVSTTPVREACFRLISEQALELRSGRFVSVPDMTRARYWQLRLMRIALEGLAAELAVENVTESDINDLQTVHIQFVASEAAGDADQKRITNREFHFGVYRLCKMDMIIDQIERLWVSMGPMMYVYYQQASPEYVGGGEHDNILDAFRRKDGAAARNAIQNDIIRGGEVFLRYFNEIAPDRQDKMIIKER